MELNLLGESFQTSEKRYIKYSTAVFRGPCACIYIHM